MFSTYLNDYIGEEECGVDDCALPLLSPRRSVAKRTHIISHEDGDFLHLQPPVKVSTLMSESPPPFPFVDVVSEIISLRQRRIDECTDGGLLFKTSLVNLCNDIMGEIFTHYLFDIRSLMCLWFTGNKSMQYCMLRLVTRVDEEDDVCTSRCINHFPFICRYLHNTRRMYFGLDVGHEIRHIELPSKLNHLTIRTIRVGTGEKFNMRCITHPSKLEYFKLIGAGVHFEETDSVTMECAASNFTSLQTLICDNLAGPVPQTVTYLELSGDFSPFSLPTNLKTLLIDDYWWSVGHDLNVFQLPPTLTRLNFSQYNTVEELSTYCPRSIREIEHTLYILSSSDVDKLAKQFPKLRSACLDIYRGMTYRSNDLSCSLMDLRNLTSLRKLRIWFDASIKDFILPPKLLTLVIDTNFLVDNPEFVKKRLSKFKQTAVLDPWTSQFELVL